MWSTLVITLTTLLMLGGLKLERDGLLKIEAGRIVHNEVASVWDLPLIVLLGRNRGDEPESLVAVRKHTEDGMRPLASLFTPAKGLVDQILRQ